MKKVSLVFAIALGAVSFAWPQTNGGQAKRSPLDGTWELVNGQQLPKVREISRSFREGTSFLLLTILGKGSCLVQAAEQMH